MRAKTAIRPHTYTPDVTVPGDHKGNRPCSVCPLPKGNQAIHRDRLDDDSDRILGESDEREDE